MEERAGGVVSWRRDASWLHAARLEGAPSLRSIMPSSWASFCCDKPSTASALKAPPRCHLLPATGRRLPAGPGNLINLRPRSLQQATWLVARRLARRRPAQPKTATKTVGCSQNSVFLGPGGWRVQISSERLRRRCARGGKAGRRDADTMCSSVFAESFGRFV